ncbi:MAG: hypothetical protein WBN57_09995 [Gammaproteobacteria bacterium]
MTAMLLMAAVVTMATLMFNMMAQVAALLGVYIAMICAMQGGGIMRFSRLGRCRQTKGEAEYKQ